MVLLYMVLHGSHQYTPFMLAYIPAPWIFQGLDSFANFFQGVHPCFPAAIHLDGFMIFYDDSESE